MLHLASRQITEFRVDVYVYVYVCMLHVCWDVTLRHVLPVDTLDSSRRSDRGWVTGLLGYWVTGCLSIEIGFGADLFVVWTLPKVACR